MRPVTIVVLQILHVGYDLIQTIKRMWEGLEFRKGFEKDLSTKQAYGASQASLRNYQKAERGPVREAVEFVSETMPEEEDQADGREDIFYIY